MTPIDRAIESTKNRIHYLIESSKDGTPSHCKEAEKQEEIQKVILDALGKRIPKRPIEIKSIEFKGAINPLFKSGNCPVCGEYVDTDDDYYYCGHKDCGQALLWSDEISNESH